MTASGAISAKSSSGAPETLQQFDLLLRDGTDPVVASRFDQIGHADRVRPPYLVAVTGADAAIRRADRFAADFRRVDESVLRHVPGHDQVRPFADLQVVLALNAASGQGVDLLQHRRRIDDHPGRDQILHMGMKDAAGDVMQLVRLVTCDDSVSRVGPPLVTNHQVKLGSQQVDKFSLGFITPLKTDHAGSGHQSRSKKKS